MNTAVKPFVFSWLFSLGYEQVLYLDPDMVIYHALDTVWQQLEEAAVVLTPHMRASAGAYDEHEYNLLKAGAYNLGFIGVSNAADEFIAWWKAWLKTHCTADLANGLFVDQKWCDLVPSLFSGVRIWRTPAVNACHWNLHERRIVRRDGEWYAQDMTDKRQPVEPLLIYHFSAYDHQQPQRVSNFGTRWTWQTLPGDARHLYEDYAVRLANAPAASADYAYSRFSAGVPIAPEARMILRLPGAQERWPRPLSDRSASGFQAYVSDAMWGMPVTPGAMMLYQSNVELQRAFRMTEDDMRRYAQWIRVHRPDLAVSWSEAPDAGVNVIGFNKAENSMGSIARGYLAALDAARVPVSSYALTHITADRQSHTGSDRYRQGVWYSANLVVANADITWDVRRLTNASIWKRHNTACWFWEFPEMPTYAHRAAELYDDFIVSSAFVAQAVKRVTGKPIHIVPPVVWQPEAHPGIHTDIPDDRFVVLFVASAYSVIERKNPLGAIEAFRRAALPNSTLVLKLGHLHQFPQKHQQVLDALEGLDARLITETLDARQMAALYNRCDAYLSLHRSEGFGLTIAEAMSLGKPCVATAYSGNLEFCREDTAWLVPAVETTLEENISVIGEQPVYFAGSVWAEPDTDAAAAALQDVYHNRDAAAQRGQRAAAFIAEHYSAGAVGQRLREVFHAHIPNGS
jgi:glycosyltransferase involved in cell wall biosynthesis